MSKQDLIERLILIRDKLDIELKKIAIFEPLYETVLMLNDVIEKLMVEDE